MDGFLLNTRALIIEISDAVEQTLNEVGVQLNLFVPKRATELLIGKKSFNADAGFVGWLSNQTPNILNFIAKIFPSFRPKQGQSAAAWLRKLNKSKFIYGAVSNIVGPMFAASSEDLPIDVFLHYFTVGKGYLIPKTAKKRLKKTQHHTK